MVRAHKKGMCHVGHWEKLDAYSRRLSLGQQDTVRKSDGSIQLTPAFLSTINPVQILLSSMFLFSSDKYTFP